MNWLFHIGIAQSLFAALLLFTRRRSNTSDKILAWWMLFIALELLHMLFEIDESPWHGYTSNFGFYALTFGPFLYLYTSFVTDSQRSWILKDYLHFAPYVLFSLVHLLFFTNRSIKSDEIQSSAFWFILNMSRVVGLLVSLTVYSLLSWRILEKHKKSILDDYSFDTSHVTLSWLRHIIVIVVFTYAVLIINLLTGNVSYQLFHTSHLIPAAGLTFFCFFLSYYGFNQPAMLRGTDDKEVPSKTAAGLTQEKRAELLAKLHKYMLDKKPFLNPELSMSQLADGMNLPRHYLTEILREELQTNFFILINGYRVKEVEKMLQDKEKAGLSLLSIALDCGFNSKSSFNALFKQNTGLTPSEYRRAAIKKPRRVGV